MIPYLINTFRGGISDESDKGVQGSFKFGYGLDIHGTDDVLTGKQAMATVFDANNTTQVGMINFFVNASDGSTYAFGSTGSIFARSGDGAWNNVYNDENGSIKGAFEWQVSGGTNYMYWATATSLARKEMPGATTAPDSGQALWSDATQDYKTTLDDAEWHTMQQASGAMCIANNNYVATLDFDEVFTAGASNIRPHNLITCLEERDDYLIMGTKRLSASEEGHMWSWIPTADNWVQKKRIPVKGVNAMINAEFNILQGGNDGELFFSEFVNAVPLHAVPGGGSVQPGGTTIEDDIAMFGFSGGDYPGIWSYGRKRKNRPHALNYPYRLAKTVVGSTISTIAAITTADGTLLASWGTTDGSTSEYGIDSVTSTTKATALYEGLEFTAGSPFLKKKFDTVHLTMDPLVDGTSINVRYKADHASTWKYAFLGSGATTHSQADTIEAIFTIGGAAHHYEVAVDLNPNENDSPRVHDITTYVSDANKNHG